MNELERAVGDFYGHHHEVFEYRGKPAVKRNVTWLKGVLKSLRVSPSQLKDMTCMEAGGAGSKALTLAQEGCTRVHYIDLSEQNTGWMRSYLANRGGESPISVTHGSILDRHSTFDDTFDLIICTGVIHSTLDPAKALMHLHAWLKMDGVLLVNCYRSGSLFFFWVYLIRDLLALIETNYTEFADLIDGHLIPSRKLEIMDQALAPVVHPTTAGIFRHDLARLGFVVIQGDEEDETHHSTTKSMLTFLVRKAQSFGGTLEELRYRRGIDQLALDYEQPCHDLLVDFSRLKEMLARSKDRKTAVILSVLEITRIFNKCRDMDRRVLGRLRNFYKTKDIDVLLRRVSRKEYFYHNLRQYLHKCLEGV